MKGINQATVLGHLGSDVEVKTFPDGGKIANLSIATSNAWTDQKGVKQEKTEWHKVVLRGRLAEIAAQYLRKGSRVYVQGPMQTRKWTDSNGHDRYTTEVIGLTMQMLDGAGNSNNSNNNQDFNGYNNQGFNQNQDTPPTYHNDIPYSDNQ